MDEQDHSTEEIEEQSDSYDRREARRAYRAERRAGRQNNGWILGAILILIGIFVILQNLTTFDLENWWALFIMIPALGAFGNAWRTYNRDGRLSAPARTSLISGFILTMITCVFLLDLNWTILGPVLLILAGAGLLLNAVLPG